jgi:O-antigen ligase
LLIQLSLAASVVLAVVVLISRRPSTAAIALMASFLLATPFITLARGLNSSFMVQEVVLAAIILRWGSAALRSLRERGAPPGAWAAVVLFAIVFFSRGVVVLRAPGLTSIQELVLFSGRFAAFLLPLFIFAVLPIDPREFRRILGWACILLTGFAVGNAIDRLGIVDLNFFAYHEILVETGYRSASLEVAQRQNTYLLGFNRASVGLFAFAGIMLLILYGWIGEFRAKVMLAVGLPLMLLLLLDSFSRAALLGLFVAGSVAIVRISPRRTLTLVILSAVGLLALPVLVGDIQPWMERFVALFNAEAFRESTGGQRVADWTRLLRYLVASPLYLLVGIGFNGYIGYVDMGVTHNVAGHNMYVHALGELGVFGLVAYTALLAVLGAAIFRQSRDPGVPESVRLVAAVMLAFYLGILATGLSQESLYPNPTVYQASTMIMMLIGVSFGFARHYLAVSAWQAYWNDATSTPADEWSSPEPPPRAYPVFPPVSR